MRGRARPPVSPPRSASPRSAWPARARVRGRMAIGSDSTLLKTALYDRHVAAGAKLVPFAGWEMPVQYTGIKEEHLAVRTKAGIFDVSHMGEIETTGPRATEFLRHLLSNDIERVAAGGAQYS